MTACPTTILWVNLDTAFASLCRDDSFYRKSCLAVLEKLPFGQQWRHLREQYKNETMCLIICWCWAAFLWLVSRDCQMSVDLCAELGCHVSRDVLQCSWTLLQKGDVPTICIWSLQSGKQQAVTFAWWTCTKICYGKPLSLVVTWLYCAHVYGQHWALTWCMHMKLLESLAVLEMPAGAVLQAVQSSENSTVHL